MPVPECFKNGNVGRWNQSWVIRCGRWEISLYAGDAIGSLPKDKWLTYDQYYKFQIGIRDKETGLHNGECCVFAEIKRKFFTAHEGYSNSIARENVDLLYEFLCYDQGVDPGGDCFLISKSNRR